MLQRAGYQPIRYFYEMVRPTLDDIVEFSLPDGLEIRPVIFNYCGVLLIYCPLFTTILLNWTEINGAPDNSHPPCYT
jgi:hypothetical protein